MKRVCLYFVQCRSRGPIKIGVTTSRGLTDRLRQLQTANPYEIRLLLAVDDVPKQLEQHLHGLFDHAQIRGEWFSPVPELLGLIDQISRRGLTDELHAFIGRVEENELGAWV